MHEGMQLHSLVSHFIRTQKSNKPLDINWLEGVKEPEALPRHGRSSKRATRLQRQVSQSRGSGPATAHSITALLHG